MIGFYCGLIIFAIGILMTVFINRNTQVSMSDDFWDIPFGAKVGILFIIFGILLACVSCLFTLIINPVELLR